MPAYRLTGRLETGELAELYKAVREDGTPVTIKLFHARTSDPAYAQVLAETSQVLNPLAHGGIVHFLEVGMVQGRLALVREFVDGFTLGVALQRLASKEVVLPPAVALHVVLGLLDAVQGAHEAGLVHGAITPGNVLLSFDGQAHLCDFGALRALQASAALKAMAGRGRGTYRAPEVAKGDPPTVESDIYSLGAIAYELLTLKELSPGKGVSTRREAIPPPSRLDRRINGRIDPIIMRAVEMVPQRRYRACSELNAALRNFLSVSGGMPSREDVARFVSELFPNEVRAESLGPVPFDGAFTLDAVAGAALPAIEAVRTGEHSGRASFTQELSLAQVLPAPEPSPASRAEPAPVSPPPSVTEWEAPAAAAAPSGPRLVRQGSRTAPAVRARPRAAEPQPRVPQGLDPALMQQPEEEHLAPPVFEDPSSAETHTARAAPESRRQEAPPKQEAPKRDLMEELEEIAAGNEAVEGTRDPGPVAPPPNPRLAALGMAVGLGCILLLAVGYVRSGKEDPPAEPIRGPDPEAAVRAPQPIERPTARGVAVEAGAHVAAPGDGFLTVESNEPAWVSVDGARRGKTPLARIPVAGGSHSVTVEALSSGEQKQFSIDVDAGRERKVMEFFQPAPARKR